MSRRSVVFVGILLAYAIGVGVLMYRLLADIDPRLTPEVRESLTLEAAIAMRSGHGGTAPQRVREQIARLKVALEAQQAWAAHYQGPRT